MFVVPQYDTRRQCEEITTGPAALAEIKNTQTLQGAGVTKSTEGYLHRHLEPHTQILYHYRLLSQ